MPNPTGIRFIGIFTGIPQDGKFILRDLPGTGKRIDVLCRALAACFDWAPEDTLSHQLEFAVVVSQERVLVIRNHEAAFNRGETWWAKSIKDALGGNPPEFIQLVAKPLKQFLKEILNGSTTNLYVLEEIGISLNSIAPNAEGAQYSFMLGNHLGFDEPTREIIQELEIPHVSLGNQSYLGSHCVATVISHFELMENERKDRQN